MPTARYTTTRGDILRFYVYHYLHSWGFVTFLIVMLAFLSHSFYRALPPEASAPVRIIVFAMFLLAGGLFLLVLFLASIAGQLWSKKNRTVTTEHVITLQEDGFREETAFNTTDQTWAAVQRLRRSRNYIFIYVAANLAHVIPKRAFGTEEEWDSFHAFCCRKTQKG